MILLMYISFTGGEDYTVAQQSVVIPALSTSSSYHINIINDMIHEDDEIFRINITLSTACLSIRPDERSSLASVTILDDEGKII